MTIEEAREKLPLLLYDELSFDEEEALHRRLEESAELRADLQKLRDLHTGLESYRLEPPLGLLADARASLFRRIEEEAAVTAADRIHGIGSFFAFLGSGFSWKPVGAFALLVLSFVGGRWTMQSAFPGFVNSADEVPRIARVRELRTNPNGTVEIQLEEVSQRMVTGSLNDREVRNVLLAAARETTDPGVRVGTLDLLNSQSGSADVRKVLLFALMNDTNAGVRLKALEGLAAFTSDAEVRDSLRKVLLADANPGVRIQAIELLTKGSESPETIGVLQQLMQSENNSYVRQKCQNALRDLNATTETF